MRPWSAIAVGAALVAGACGSSDVASPEPQSSTTTIETTIASTSTTTMPPATLVTSSTDSTGPTSTVTTVPLASSTSAPTSVPAATTSTLPLSPLVLRGDGLGIVEFGDPAEDVLATLTDLFGAPSFDTLVESPFDLPEGWTGPDRGVVACHVVTVPIFGGHICFDYIRVTSWSDIGLSVVFSDLMIMPGLNDTDYVEVPPSLRGYGYRAGDTGPPAQTIEGISASSTVRELMALGDQVTFLGPGCGDNAEFVIDDPDAGDSGRIYGVLDYDHDEPHEMEFLDSGYLDPASLDPDTTVVWLGAGAQRSC